MNLKNEQFIAIDTETTGLRPHGEDRLISIQIATKDNVYFLNYNDENQSEEYPALNRNTIPSLLDGFSGVIFMHNAKFDSAFLEKEGLKVPFHLLFDTKVGARILDNNLPSYSLDSLTGQKDDTVKKYISKNKLYTKIKVEGKKKVEKILHYEKVPIDMLASYGKQDARITYDLGISLHKRLQESSSLNNLFAMEMRLLEVLFKMEKAGILIDKEYLDKSSDELKLIVGKTKKEFQELTGISNVSSRKELVSLFESLGAILPMSDKGNASINYEALKKLNFPEAKLLLKLRDYEMRLGTFFSSYQFLVTKNNTMHASFDQAGTDTGRFSMNSPNLQQCHKEEENHSVRRCFIPRPDHVFVSIDFNQMEYRLLLDLAEETQLINMINDLGYDVHQATAEAMTKSSGHPVSRSNAKTINFGMLYGCGVGKLSQMLDVPYSTAKTLHSAYFNSLKNVVQFINRATMYTQQHGKIENIYGREYKFNDNFYKAINYIIQGSCADIVKNTMIKVDEYLKDKKSRIILQVHDELLFEIHKSEMHIIEPIKYIMENEYKYKKLKLTCSSEILNHSWEIKDLDNLIKI